MSTKRRVRKPRTISVQFEGEAYIGGGDDNVIIKPFWRPLPSTLGPFMQLDTAKDCRRLAKWLERASEYLAWKERGK